MSPQAKALVFDFDGVLADTEPLYWKAWADLLALHGCTLSWEEYCRHGRGVKDGQMLERLPQLAADPSILPSVKQQMGSRKEMIREWCSRRSPIAQPTIRMLQSLKDLALGLVTSSDRADVEPMLRSAGIYHCFEALVFAEDVDRHKPDPKPYLLIRENLGIESGIAFEDSDAGMESAAKAGFTTIRIDDPSELPELVAKILQSS